jgi:hypothetical protein
VELPDELITQIRESLVTFNTGPLGTVIHFQLIDRADLIHQKIKLGTYGFIQGARYFIAGSVVPDKNTFLDYGYCLEKIILAMTGMGLGTCWLGGTFDRSEFARAIGLPEGHSIPAVTPVGYATSIRGLGDQIVRLSAGSANRLPWKNLFFDHELGHPLTQQDTGKAAHLLEAVRLAPSASNRQPWRIFRDVDIFHFALARTPGYRNKYISADLQMVDMGIAMSHWDLAAAETGIRSVWNQDPPPELPSEPEYIISSQLG